MKELMYIKVGSSVNIGGAEYTARLSREGCKGCAFRAEAGAKHCKAHEFCMGHLRPDKTPVIFTKK